MRRSKKARLAAQAVLMMFVPLMGQTAAVGPSSRLEAVLPALEAFERGQLELDRDVNDYLAGLAAC